jgi:hypothetical protein
MNPNSSVIYIHYLLSLATQPNQALYHRIIYMPYSYEFYYDIDNPFNKICIVSVEGSK